MHLYTVDQGKKGQENGEGSKEAVEDHVITLFLYKGQPFMSFLPSQCAGFYALLPDGMSGSISYMAKAVVNTLLQQGLSYDISKQCCIS